MDKVIKLFFNNLPFPVWIKDMDLRFIYVNDVYIKKYNKKREDFIGYKNEDVFNIRGLDSCNDHCREVIKTRRIKTQETYIDNRYCQCCTFPIMDEDDNVIAIAGIQGALNINELEAKNIEIEMQKNITKQIIDILPGIIFYKDTQSRYVYANKECRNFYSDRGIDNIIGKNELEIQEDDERAKRFLADDKKIIKYKKPIFNEEIFIKNNGKKEYRDVVKMPLFDSYGKVKGIVGRSMDITAIRSAEEKLRYLSYTDILTGVKNRAAFEERSLDLSNEKSLPLGVIMGDANGLKLVNDTFGHVKGDQLLKLIAKVLQEVCGDKGEVFRIGGDEFVILIPNSNVKTCEAVIKSIIKKCESFEDNLLSISISLGAALKTNPEEDIYDVLREAEDKVYRQKLLQKGSMKASILNSLKIGLAVKSMETEEHTHRVSQYATLVGEKLDLDMATLDELTIVGELHDIGKIGISEEILLKPGRLTDEEYDIMKTHVEKGYRIIKAANELDSVAKGVLYHHERWDGKGYPMGLKGEEIPLISRIISVVDSYDVMTNDRVYKKAMNKEEAIEELERCSGTQFDPVVTECFINCIK